MESSEERAFGSDINVHELQHALRLCELYELADNFKVRKPRLIKQRTKKL